MNNIEKLKQELLNQKQNIENKGGNVVVANSNPSPAEITQGITTIHIPDLTTSDATEEDVRYGKTFFSGSDTLRTGTYNEDATIIKHLYEYPANEKSIETPIEYICPEQIKAIRPYSHYLNKNTVNYVFHSGLESIGNYSFYGTSNFTFEGMENLEKVTQIGEYAFQDTNPYGVDFTKLPPNVVTILIGAFRNAVKENCEMEFPYVTKSIGSYAFYMPEKTYCKSITFLGDSVNYSRTESFGSSVFENLIFNCDLTVPVNCTSLPYKFNYNGSFNNITLNVQMSGLYQYCFGAAETMPISDIRLKTLTFTRKYPISVFYDNSIPIQAVENGLKIYVPDESLEGYKAKLTTYVDLVYPISQKP